MPSLVLVRTSVLFFAAICACSALSLSTSREEEPTPTSDSAMTGIIPKGTTNHSAASEDRISYSDSKSDESRVLPEADKDFLQLGLSLGRTTPQTPLRGITNFLEHIGVTAATGEKKELPLTFNLGEGKKGQTLIKTMDFSWANDKEREEWFHVCLAGQVSPDVSFQYMKVNLRYSLKDTHSIDPKLLWWLDYVNMYRKKLGADTTETALRNTATSSTTTSSMATSREVYSDEKLFNFLVDQYDLQPAKKDISLAVVSSEMLFPDSRSQVVALFQVLRGKPSSRSLADKMLLYLVTTSKTQPVVLQTWLRIRVSPAIIFDILPFGDMLGRSVFINEAILTLWLAYVEKYWELVSPSIGQFSYYDFICLLGAKLKPEHVKPVLDSIISRQLLVSPGSRTHEGNLMNAWAIWQGQSDSTTPQGFFFSLNPTGKFSWDGLRSVQGFMYLKSYRMRKQFTDEEVFNMLSPANSIEAMVRLFKRLRSISYLHDLAISMLEYVSTVNQVAEMTPDEYWRVFLSKDTRFPVDNFLLLKWFHHARFYFMRVKNESLEHATFDVLSLLQKIEPHRHEVIQAFLKQALLKRERDELLPQEGGSALKKLKSSV